MRIISLAVATTLLTAPVSASLYQHAENIEHAETLSGKFVGPCRETGLAKILRGECTAEDGESVLDNNILIRLELKALTPSLIKHLSNAPSNAMVDFSPPTLGTEWKIDPIRIGSLSVNEILKDNEGKAKEVGRRNFTRTLSLSVLNLSSEDSANIIIKCNLGVTTQPPVKIEQKIAENGSAIIGIGSEETNNNGIAHCVVTSDMKVMIVALAEETTRVETTNASDSLVAPKRAFVWPAFRVYGAD